MNRVVTPYSEEYPAIFSDLDFDRNMLYLIRSDETRSKDEDYVANTHY